MKKGEIINIKTGAFQGFDGEVIEVLNNGKYKVKVTIFGRVTEVEIELKDNKSKAYLAPKEVSKRNTLERADYQSWWLNNNYNNIPNPNIKAEINTIIAIKDLNQLNEKHTALHQIFLKEGWRSLNDILKNWISTDFELFPINEAPKDFHWQFDTNNPKIIIDKLFSPIAKNIMPLITALKTETLCIMGIRVHNKDHLLYVGEYQNSAYYDYNTSTAFLLGDVPNPSLELNQKAINIGWKTPPSQLVEFSAIHTRLGNLPYIDEYINTCYGIIPINELSEMEFMNKIVKEQNHSVDYDFRNLLEFYSHGDGNGYHFYKMDTDIPTSNQVAYWDHETRELVIKDDFWDFLNTEALSEWFGYRRYY